MPNVDPRPAYRIAFAAVRLRERNISKRDSGTFANRPSIRTGTRIAGRRLRRSARASTADPQPVSSVRTMPSTSRDRPTVALVAPAKSKLTGRSGIATLGDQPLREECDGQSDRDVDEQDPAPTEQRREIPPRRTPAAPPAPPIAPQIPIARLRSAGFVKVVVRIDSEAGAITAPRAPAQRVRRSARTGCWRIRRSSR